MGDNPLYKAADILKRIEALGLAFMGEKEEAPLHRPDRHGQRIGVAQRDSLDLLHVRRQAAGPGRRRGRDPRRDGRPSRRQRRCLESARCDRHELDRKADRPPLLPPGLGDRDGSSARRGRGWGVPGAPGTFAGPLYLGLQHQRRRQRDQAGHSRRSASAPATPSWRTARTSVVR